LTTASAGITPLVRGQFTRSDVMLAVSQQRDGPGGIVSVANIVAARLIHRPGVRLTTTIGASGAAIGFAFLTKQDAPAVSPSASLSPEGPLDWWVLTAGLPGALIANYNHEGLATLISEGRAI
jgi:hypothetical protein